MDVRIDQDWLLAEAANQGLPMTEEDAGVVARLLSRIKVALVEAHQDEIEGIEPAYRFVRESTNDISREG
jgi:hypothetical protein